MGRINVVRKFESSRCVFNIDLPHISDSILSLTSGLIPSIRNWNEILSLLEDNLLPYETFWSSNQFSASFRIQKVFNLIPMDNQNIRFSVAIDFNFSVEVSIEKTKLVEDVFGD